MNNRFSSYGHSLVELMVSSLIVALLIVGVGKMIQLVARMGLSASKMLPVQRETLHVTKSLEMDLLGASRFSILNDVPFGGFEGDGNFLLASTTSSWAAPPLQFDPVNLTAMATARLNFNPRFVRTGRGSLLVTSFGNPFGALSPVFTLQNGTYRVGAWVMQRPTGVARTGGIIVLGDANLSPVTPVGSFVTNSTQWTYVSGVFIAQSGLNYRVRLGPTDNGNTTTFFFDNLFVGLESADLLPGNGQKVDFERFNPTSGVRTRVRYELLASGNFVRRTLNPDGTVLTERNDFSNIRRVSLARVPTANVFPPDRAVALTIESGGGQAQGGSFNFSFSVWPPTP